MAFELIGTRDGRDVSISWDAGELESEDAELLADVRAEAATRRIVGPVGGPYTTADHLESPLSALVLMTELMDSVDDTDGEVPEVPKPPPGAVV